MLSFGKSSESRFKTNPNWKCAQGTNETKIVIRLLRFSLFTQLCASFWGHALGLRVLSAKLVVKCFCFDSLDPVVSVYSCTDCHFSWSLFHGGGYFSFRLAAFLHEPFNLSYIVLGISRVAKLVAYFTVACWVRYENEGYQNCELQIFKVLCSIEDRNQDLRSISRFLQSVY